MNICWLIGHRESFNDSGYPVCSCGAHSYYSPNDWMWLGIIGYISIPSQMVKEILKKHFKLCYGCNKLRTIFGKDIGKHSECFPF